MRDHVDLGDRWVERLDLGEQVTEVVQTCCIDVIGDRTSL